MVCDSDGFTLLSYFGPTGHCSVNKAELLALLNGLRETNHLNLYNLRAERDKFCIIQWTSGEANPPWKMVDIFEEVKSLGLLSC